MPKLTDVVLLSEKRCREPIRCELKYATPDNFVGRIIEGYHPDTTNTALLTPKVADVLCEVQNNLIKNHQMRLRVFDAYRPRRAVLDFLVWAGIPFNELDRQRKPIHYPRVEKSQLFVLGYLSQDSQHCYGNSVDCVLEDLAGNRLEMGSVFDFFGPQSHSAATAKEIGETAYRYREILSRVMQRAGFKPAQTEYWHFSHPELKEIHEPLDIPISDCIVLM